MAAFEPVKNTVKIFLDDSSKIRVFSNEKLERALNRIAIEIIFLTLRLFCFW
jgi:hypothetical protein